MWGLFLKLGPIAAGLLGSAGSIAIVSAGFWLWNNLVDNPGIVREQRAICVAQVEKAASDAKAAEQLRQFQIAERATEQALREQSELQAAHDADISKITEEAKRYAAERLAQGRSCPLTPGDIEFLDGMHVRGSH